jgi:four helix bundle protein
MDGLNRLEVFRLAQELANYVYQNVLNKLPAEEKFGLSSQIRRATASIPANIAEGYGRYYYQETIRFCYLARGSLMELSSHIELACSQGYLPVDMKSHVDELMLQSLRLIHGYIKYLKQSKRGWNEPGSNQVNEMDGQYFPDALDQKIGTTDEF